MDSWLPVLEELWKEWDLRAFVIISFLFQAMLIFTGSLRMRTSHLISNLVIWSAYLLADWVATFALGILAKGQGGSSDSIPKAASDSQYHNDELLAFWSPFLLLHLGGPDTITAFSLEDNELWPRHLLGLLFQVSVAIYAFLRSVQRTRLLLPALLMFIVGIVKFGERTWALMSASVDNLRRSMVSPPDAGPNYAKFMEEYASKKNAGLEAKIVIIKEPSTSNSNSQEHGGEESNDPLYKAHQFYLKFRCLIVDLILSFHDRNDSQSFFMSLKFEKAFKVVEHELSFIYEMLYTKAPVIHSTVGPWLRVLTFVLTSISLTLFIFTEKSGYIEKDVFITYILLGGGLFLETWAFTLLLSSDEAFLSGISIFRSLWRNQPKWSGTMAQCNLISVCLADEPRRGIAWIMNTILVKEWHSRIDIPVSPQLKEFIFQRLKSTVAEHSRSYKRLCKCRGELALQMTDCREKLRWSIDVEFDESILLWHIATDLCYYHDYDKNDAQCGGRSEHPHRGDSDLRAGLLQESNHYNEGDISKALSDYMLYLLIFRPSMMTAGIGQIRYGDTIAEASNFFKRSEKKQSNYEACKMLRMVDTSVLPIQVKGDRSKSVLFDACRLAKELLEMGTAKWDIMNAVWAEILCYAASHCRGYNHAQRLSKGGELLTFVWFLMAHFGIGEMYQIEAGHARAKLIVEK
ncbi:hypothetical protein QJS10_CPB15g01358 [Acorus calamus]|uniref:DUF4220 domain-containing protein n=1 Tax=Acorus calamus TaxID=4465 RepID=A0AAV9D683_ACOCL|nr:hypothetical protein QJS10_CPB15g01358 [Acorus calamus]